MGERSTAAWAPADAYRSASDDKNLLLAHAGAISIVVPDFAQLPLRRPTWTKPDRLLVSLPSR